jgi:hypothetical protein
MKQSSSGEKMKRTLFLLVAIVFCLWGTASAQVSAPVSVSLGIGGGVSMPTGDLSNVSSNGYHGMAKLRLGSLLPFDITGSAAYHHIPDKEGSESVNMYQGAVGLECPLPIPEIKPYVGAEFAYNSMKSTVSGAESKSREGVNIVAGVQLMGFEGMVQYQMLNLMGKEDIALGVSEPTYNQITISVLYSIGL